MKIPCKNNGVACFTMRVLRRHCLSLHRLVGVATAVALTSCATGPSPLDQRLASIPSNDHAFIVGTFLVTCRPSGSYCVQAFNSLSTYYRSQVDSGIWGTLSSTYGSMFSENTKFDFVDQAGGQKGFHFCIALPAGAFEFYSYSFYNYAGGGSGFSLPKKNQFSVPFSLAPGELLNLGQIKLSTTVGKNMFGMSLPAPGSLIFSPSSSPVLADAIKKCPESVRARPMKLAELSTEVINRSALIQTIPAPFIPLVPSR